MIFYRYEIQQSAVLGADGDFTSPLFPNVEVVLKEYILIRTTLKGYWISSPVFKYNKNFHIWVSASAVKRFAYPTKQSALNNFVLRTQKRVKILSNQLDVCKIALNQANKLTNEN